MPITRPTLTKLSERGTRDGSSPRESFGLQAVGSDTKRFVKFSERFKAIDYYLGHSRLNGGVLERLTPIHHPEDPLLYATRMEGAYNHKPTGQTTTTSGEIIHTWDKVEMLVHYERFPYKVKEDADIVVAGTPDETLRYTFIGEERPSADYVSLPGGAILYTRSSGSTAPHGQPIPFNVGLVLPVIEFPVTWYRLPESLIDFTAPGAFLKRLIGDSGSGTKPYIGCVNKTAIFGFAAGTLLFSTYRRIIRPIPVNIAGTDPGFEWDFEYTFAYDMNGWNFKYFWDMQGGGSASGWYEATKGGTYQAPGSITDGNCLYNEREFRDLFKVS